MRNAAIDSPCQISPSNPRFRYRSTLCRCYSWRLRGFSFYKFRTETSSIQTGDPTSTTSSRLP